MQGGYFSYGLLTALAIALLIAAFTDLRRREIDNWLNGIIALGAPLFWLSTGLSLVEIGYQLAMATATFAICAVLFAIRVMGGGDVKLLTALALWIEPLWFAKLLLVMSVLGGVLTLVFGAWHVARRRRDRIAIPYGIAISAAGLWVIAGQSGAMLPGSALG
ncbi:MAG TPA: prepilin peptidase [Novosphingobium sp.]